VVSLATGGVFWGPTFFDREIPMLATLQAQGRTALVLRECEQILPLLVKSGKLLQELCGLLVAHMTRASDVAENLAFHPVAHRLVAFAAGAVPRPGESRLSRDLTREELTAWAGTTWEMICRTP